MCSQEINELIENLVSSVMPDESNFEKISDVNIQKLNALALKLYKHKISFTDQNLIKDHGFLEPLPDSITVTQTEAIIFVDRLLAQQDVELFEVQLFRSLG